MDPSLSLIAPQKYEVNMNFSSSNNHLNSNQESVLKDERNYFLLFFKILSKFPTLNNNQFLIEPYSKGCFIKSKFSYSYTQIQKLSQITQAIFSKAIDAGNSGVILAKTLKNESCIYVTEPRKKINLALEEEVTACMDKIFSLDTLMDIISNVAMEVGLVCQTSQEQVFISHDEGKTSSIGKAVYIKFQPKNSQPGLNNQPEQIKKPELHQNTQLQPKKELFDEKIHILNEKEQSLAIKEKNLLTREELLQTRERKIAEKEKNIKEKEEEDLCKICYDKPINAIPLPCAHLSFCIDCIMNIQTCSICNGNIAQKVRVYRT
ncbi:MAG: hypothetical protein BGO14_05945 [Chlamydiales bacterium 38-26]|nr:hypothetical protein [Chlamydiales bacterium]OJV08435.1 MAG: hypothetical protein BGO14_05945 [Chlamydiales bacterium 38-26]